MPKFFQLFNSENVRFISNRSSLYLTTSYRFLARGTRHLLQRRARSNQTSSEPSAPTLAEFTTSSLPSHCLHTTPYQLPTSSYSLKGEIPRQSTPPTILITFSPPLRFGHCSTSSITVSLHFSLRALVRIHNGSNNKTKEMSISSHSY